MEFGGHDIDTEYIVTTVNSNSYDTIVLQFPEGLKIFAHRIADVVRDETDAEIIINMDPCYGACDLIDMLYRKDDVKAIYHIGHETMGITTGIPTYYIKVRKGIDKDAGEIIAEYMKQHYTHVKSIGIVTTSQHIDEVQKLSEFLEKSGYEAIWNGTAHILGCNYANAMAIENKVDIFLFLGSGNFHPVGLSLQTEKEILLFDPYTSTVSDIKEEKERFLRRRYAVISSAMDFETAGIIISTKPGQYHMKRAVEIAGKIRNAGKKAYLISMHNIHDIPYFPVDINIITACPRIPIDDSVTYSHPVLTPGELEMILENKLEKYIFG